MGDVGGDGGQHDGSAGDVTLTVTRTGPGTVTSTPPASTAAPWYRVDDVAVLPATAAWATASYFDASPNLSVDGSMTFGNSADWAGATSLTTAGTAVSTCNNWGSTTASAWTGNANRNQISLFFGSSLVQCNNPSVPITCLQE